METLARPLEFGSFITPLADPPAQAVDLALASERAGLNLVTFQDHPYLPSFYDTWTLLSFVAARTEHVQLAANVTNLPLRPPAMLARSVASLDRLSGGRVALGLGSGASWEGIEAMGGPKRTPGQAVDALDEAIQIVRGLWDTSQTGGLFHRGKQYQIVGAKRGPEPAHPIPIWIGAYGPRMLNLVGRHADGWLPSVSYLDSLDTLLTGNARIDDAAQAAGRDPADIRRLLNIGPDLAEPSQLADIALRYRIDTFILGSESSDEIHRFGTEVAPSVREMVANA